MAATAASVLTGAIINIVTALIGLLVFSYLRRWHKAYKFYDARVGWRGLNARLLEGQKLLLTMHSSCFDFLSVAGG
jgi:hypothetical protein